MVAASVGLDGNLFGILSVVDEVSDLYFKAGITESEINETIAGGGGPVREFDTSSTDDQVGAGVWVNLLKDRSLGLRLDYAVGDTKTRVESWDTVALSFSTASDAASGLGPPDSLDCRLQERLLCAKARVR